MSVPEVYIFEILFSVILTQNEYKHRGLAQVSEILVIGSEFVSDH